MLTICLGKSTYARCGIIVNVTPFEPEWEGHVTLEISNTTPLPAKIYANEGIAQVLFFQSDEHVRDLLQGQEGQVPGAARRYAPEDYDVQDFQEPTRRRSPPSVYVDESAQVIGDVLLGEESSLDERGRPRRREPYPHRHAALISRT